eukprot:3357561-Amphidinium_carterae.1
MAMAINYDNFHYCQACLEGAGGMLQKYVSVPQLCIGMRDCLLHVVESLWIDHYQPFERKVLLSHVRPHHEGESVPDGWNIVALIRKNHDPLQFQ